MGLYNLSMENALSHVNRIVDETEIRKKFLRIVTSSIFIFGLNRILTIGGKLVSVVPIEVEFNGLTIRIHLPKELFQTDSDMVLSISFLSIYGPEMIISKEDGSPWRRMEPILLKKNPSPQTVVETIIRLSVEAGGYPGVPGVCRICCGCGELKKFHLFKKFQLSKGRYKSRCKNCVKTSSI